MLILAILAFGMGIGWFAQLVLGKGGRQTDWAMALIAGLGRLVRRRPARQPRRR